MNFMNIIYIYMQHMHISYNMSSDMFAKHLLGVICLLFPLRLQEARETLFFFHRGEAGALCGYGSQLTSKSHMHISIQEVY